MIQRNVLGESFFFSFWNTFTKFNVKGVNIQQLLKIGLKFIISLSQVMRTLHKILCFCQHNLKYWVQAAIYVIERRMFPAVQFLCHLKWNAWLASCLCCHSGDKQVPILKLCMQINDAEKTQNTTFVLISIYIHCHSKWNTLPVCLKPVTPNLRYEKWYRNGPMRFLIFNPRRMVCLRCLTVRRWRFFAIAELCCASPQTSTSGAKGRIRENSMVHIRSSE